MIHGMPSRPLHLQESVGVFSDPSLQKEFILTHPLSFLKAALLTLDGNLAGGMLGTFGVGNIFMPNTLYYVLFTVIFLSFGLPPTKKYKPTLLIPSLIIVAIVAIHVIAVMGGGFMSTGQIRSSLQSAVYKGDT